MATHQATGDSEASLVDYMLPQCKAVYTPPVSTGTQLLASSAPASSTSAANPRSINSRPDEHTRRVLGKSPLAFRKT